MKKAINPDIDKNFQAIKAVHAHLDDDRDGQIGVDESVEVLNHFQTKFIFVFLNLHTKKVEFILKLTTFERFCFYFVVYA